MKKYLTILLLPFFFNLHAQQFTDKQLKKHSEKVSESKDKGTIIRSLDTIYKSGVSYAVLKEKKVMLTSNYTLFSLNGIELIDIPWESTGTNNTSDEEEYYFAFLFLKSGKRAEVRNYLGIKVEKLIVENDLVKDNGINPAGENKFLMKYPPKYSTKQQNGTTIIVINNGDSPTNTDMYQTVERNRNAMLFTMGGKIKQDGKEIGSYKSGSTSNSGKLVYTYSFYLPNGTKIAEATADSYTATEWKIVTVKDNKTHTVTTKSFSQDETIAKHLIDLYYL